MSKKAYYISPVIDELHSNLSDESLRRIGFPVGRRVAIPVRRVKVEKKGKVKGIKQLTLWG